MCAKEILRRLCPLVQKIIWKQIFLVLVEGKSKANEREYKYNEPTLKTTATTRKCNRFQAQENKKLLANSKRGKTWTPLQVQENLHLVSNGKESYTCSKSLLEGSM